jgi:glycosyltransferase involved in cell wall biosynthesis
MRPRRILMTVDAVGGVWRYALDLARAMQPHGFSYHLLGFGPQPGGMMARECAGVENVELTWAALPLDWMVEDERALDEISAAIMERAQDWRADLLHLNVPSQAAGLAADFPVVVASHSCVPSWWQAIRCEPMPPLWQWQKERNQAGLARADGIVAPSETHGRAIQAVYGPLARLSIVPNATMAVASPARKQPFVLAAGRWWDEAKNGVVLDTAAAHAVWPVVMAGPIDGPNGQRFFGHHAAMEGPLPAAAVLDLMRVASVFAAPSRYEPFGLAVLEAAVHGAALILSDIPTFRELWDGAAVFVPAQDPLAWAGAINALSADTAHTGRLADLARRRAGRFTPESQAGAMLQAYASAVATHSTHALPAA